MKKVTLCIVESPFAPRPNRDPIRKAVEAARNEAYVNACLADSFRRGEVPFASHGIYTRRGVLDDTKPEERKKGMDAGFVVAEVFQLADRLTHQFDEDIQVNAVRAFYIDRGWSGGMVDGVEQGARIYMKHERRKLNAAILTKEMAATYVSWSFEDDDKFELAHGQLVLKEHHRPHERAA